MFDNETLLFKYNVDTEGNPISIQVDKEQKQVSINGTIQMEFIPDEFNSINMLGDNNQQMYEVFNRDEITANTYYVDYSSGTIYYDKSQFGKVKLYNYYSRGIQMMGASRIYDEKSINGELIVKTIQDIIDEGRKCLELIKSLGDAVLIINKLDQDIKTGTILHENLTSDIEIGTPLDASLKSNITKGNTLLPQLISANDIATQKKEALDTSIQNAENTNTTLTNTNQSATQTNLTLQQTIATASDDIAKINSTGNKSLIIGASQFVNNEYTWQHNMNNDNLVVNFIDSDTKEPLMQDYKIIDKNNILIRNSVEHPNIKVILSASYYQGNALFGTNVEEFASDNIATNAKKVRLKDNNGVIQNPVTNSDAVFMPDGSTKLTNKINDINTQLADIIDNKIDDDVLKPIELSGSLQGTITLQRGKTYVAKDDLIIEENSKIDGKWATIKKDGIINIGDNVEIYNVNFETETALSRDNEVCISQKSISLVIGNNVNIHNCTGNGITIYASDKKGFKINDNILFGGYSVGGTVQAFNNCTGGEIKRNVIHGSSHNGIAIHTSHNIIIEENECYKNGHSGIWTPYSTKLRIKKNRCHDHSVFDGIDLNFGSDNLKINFDCNSEVVENECYDNCACGITIVGSNIIVSKNRCYNNGFNGIRLDRYVSGDTTEAWNVNILDNIVYDNNTITAGHNISMASFILSVIRGNISYYNNSTTSDVKAFYLDGDRILVSENIGYKRNDTQQNEKVDTIIGTNNTILGNKFSYNDSDVNINNLYSSGNIKTKDLFACELGNINMFGNLPIGHFKIGYENTPDGNYYLVVGTENGNKKIELV